MVVGATLQVFASLEVIYVAAHLAMDRLSVCGSGLDVICRAVPFVVHICHEDGMVKETTKKTQLVFYRSNSGKEPVRDWLKALDASDRLAVGQDLMRAQ